jgi:hypothetical protein
VSLSLSKKCCLQSIFALSIAELRHGCCCCCLLLQDLLQSCSRGQDLLQSCSRGGYHWDICFLERELEALESVEFFESELSRLVFLVMSSVVLSLLIIGYHIQYASREKPTPKTGENVQSWIDSASRWLGLNANLRDYINPVTLPPDQQSHPPVNSSSLVSPRALSSPFSSRSSHHRKVGGTTVGNNPWRGLSRPKGPCDLADGYAEDGKGGWGKHCQSTGPALRG